MKKRLWALMVPLLLLSSCRKSEGRQAEELTSALRGAWLEAAACAGSAEITADYGRRVFTYGVDFTWQREGETVLTITSPENIAGVTARIAKGETTLEFDGMTVETGPVNSAGLSPMDVLPALLTYIREGYVALCGLEEGERGKVLRLTCRDPDKGPGEGTACDLWFDPDSFALLHGELSEGGETVIRCAFSDFTLERPAK